MSTTLFSLAAVELRKTDEGAHVTTYFDEGKLEGHEGRDLHSSSSTATVKAIGGAPGLRGSMGKKVPHQHYCKDTGCWKVGVLPHPQLHLKV